MPLTLSAVCLVLLICVIASASQLETCARQGNKMSSEQTFIMIKPDGVARGLVGEVIKRFEQKVGSPGAFV